MSGSFDIECINSTWMTVERRCLTLLSEGYRATKSNGNVSIDWEEEDISKNLLLCLNTSRKRQEWRIEVAPEFRIYENDGIPAKRASRVDFRFSSWATAHHWEYFAEAKNLIEADSYKSGRKTKVSAAKLHKRYVETGIDHYISGKYPADGCLIGYILQGKVENIISLLNECLCKSSRAPEILKQHGLGIEGLNFCYVSTHDDSLSIKHLMLDYTSN